MQSFDGARTAYCVDNASIYISNSKLVDRPPCVSMVTVRFRSTNVAPPRDSGLLCLPYTIRMIRRRRSLWERLRNAQGSHILGCPSPYLSYTYIITTTCILRPTLRFWIFIFCWWWGEGDRLVHLRNTHILCFMSVE